MDVRHETQLLWELGELRYLRDDVLKKFNLGFSSDFNKKDLLKKVLNDHLKLRYNDCSIFDNDVSQVLWSKLQALNGAHGYTIYRVILAKANVSVHGS